jgi:predicted NUDIX family NTP pyrophosphohydrolase
LGFSRHGEFVLLGRIEQKAGKTVQAWAFEGDCDPHELKSNIFTVEWPPRSGKQQEFPEVDRAAFFRTEESMQKINPAQVELLIKLERIIASSNT